MKTTIFFLPLNETGGRARHTVSGRDSITIFANQLVW